MAKRINCPMERHCFPSGVFSCELYPLNTRQVSRILWILRIQITWHKKHKIGFCPYRFIRTRHVAHEMLCYTLMISICMWNHLVSACGWMVPQRHYWPRQTARLHHVGQRHIVGPHVVLPLPQAQHAAEHPACVQTHSHVQVHLGGLHHRPAGGTEPLASPVQLKSPWHYNAVN